MLENYIEILVVDDDPFLLQVMASYLTRENGFDATFVDDGAVAIAFLQAKEFDVVLTDIVMPTTNGIELIDQLRKFNKNTPVIAMTSGDLQNRTNDLIDHAHYFANQTLQKPFTKEQLIQSIEEVLNMRIADIFQWI